ncbi:hypothetical protein K469DRAFT_734956 [Zopfia rhizophila CBS 207.26]|uniref:Phosphatidate cytidylyltransferase n=1 Tax=Zopfia rhizophila CBS 207.26 TaxID=1314779 RepID=A0A6A6EV64_9PEZI|nr:hypothetical protein K469DRAFT_734956 [Zopfia rhizophila CBS 207.26]
MALGIIIIIILRELAAPLLATTVASPPPLPDDAARPDEFASTLAPPNPIVRLASDTDASTTITTVDNHGKAEPTPQTPQQSDRHSLLENVAYYCVRASLSLTGLIRSSPLPSFPLCLQQAMASSRQYQVPQTPRVISPSPDPSDTSAKDGYFGPTTRSAARKNRRPPSPPPIDEDSSSSDPEKRARARSRSPILAGQRRRMSGLMAMKKVGAGKKGDLTLPNGTVNGHLSPAAANKNYWREMSRSPSPLGLIPIHQKWRSFIHRHEIPRKILHVSIGFLTIFLYCTGRQPDQIHPVLLTLLIPIAATDVIRHRYPSINRFYIRCLGALMRESEVDGWNGVISYLLGAWIVLRFCPKDIGVMSVLLLSWCDTAASTFGRLWGHRTWRVRRGKSLAGSIAACVTGVITAAFFWGWLAPQMVAYDQGENAFAFLGVLALPSNVRNAVGLSFSQSSITGYLALSAMSIWAGLVASASEAIDLFGWDDNLTIPALCGAGLWGFLRVFG